MATLNDLINPQELIGFVRGLEFPEFTLEAFLPRRQLDSNEFRYTPDTRLDQDAAEFRAWDTETPIGTRQGISRVTGELPPIGKKMLLTEEQYLKLRAAQTGNYGPMVTQIYDDLGNLTRGVEARYELARGQVLSTGTVVINENGINTTVNYGIPGGNIVTAATLWSNTGAADPIADLTTWSEAYALANRGRRPGIALVSSATVGHLLRNAAIRSYLATIVGTPTILSRAAVDAELAARGLPRLVVNDTQVQVNGVTQRVIPANKVILLPDGANVGQTFQGVTAEALRLVEAGTITAEQAPGIVGLTYQENDPPRQWNQVASVGLPVLGEPQAVFIATVA